MENKSNSVFKDILILCLITLIAGTALGYINQLTQGTITEQKLSAKVETYKKLYSEAEHFQYDNELSDQVKLADKEIGSLNFGNVHVEEAVQALDNSGNVIGYIISTTTGDGYNGDIAAAVGIASDGTVIGVEMLEINETAGLGSKANDKDFKEQYAGKKVEAFSVSKDGNSADNEIEAISGATITSTAVTNAVNASLYFKNNYIGK